MCFSIEADVAAGVGLLPVAAVSLRRVRHAREVPFASLPLLFALHQLVEAVVWAGLGGEVPGGLARVAALAYVVVALPVLPVLVPLSVVMIEPRGARWRAAPFVALGGVVAAHLGPVVLRGPVEAVRHPHALTYTAPLEEPVVWTTLYVVAVIGPCLLSGHRSIVVLGVANAVGLTVVAVVYTQAVTSWWCLWAALSSVLVAAHMCRRCGAGRPETRPVPGA